MRAGGATARILGINRLPGSNEDCGVPGFVPTDEPRQGTICTGADDLVLFTPEFGAPLPSGTAVQALLDPAGRVVSIGSAGGSLPAGDSLTPQTSVVSAAPILLRDGGVAIDAFREGVFDPRDLNNYSFSAERHGRTFAGVDRRGRLILITADGIPGVSEGLTLTEEAKLMQSLGAVDAMNLDGGGSTSFVVNGQTVNDPSDATGARPVGDTVVVVP